MTPELDGLVLYGLVAGVGEELVASGAAKVRIGVELGVTGGEELAESGAAKVKTGVKLGGTVGE